MEHVHERYRTGCCVEGVGLLLPAAHRDPVRSVFAEHELIGPDQFARVVTAGVGLPGIPGEFSGLRHGQCVFPESLSGSPNERLCLHGAFIEFDPLDGQGIVTH